MSKKKAELPSKEKKMSHNTQHDKDEVDPKAEAKAAKEAEKLRIKEEKAAEKARLKAEKANQPKAVRNTMAKSWGETFHIAATEGKDQAWVEQEMLARHPNKEETISKWTTWYKNFYNMGRIKGFENPVQVNWKVAEDQDKIAAREQKKAEKLAAREQAKAEKAQAKAEAREQKKAAKQAEKDAERESANV